MIVQAGSFVVRKEKIGEVGRGKRDERMEGGDRY